MKQFDENALIRESGTHGELGPLGDLSPLGGLGPLGDLSPLGDLGPLGELGPLGDLGPLGELDALRRRFASHVPGLLGADREYAVLCPLVERPEGLSLLFEVRAAGIRQGGEVCFPGGRLEAGETPVQCALRETEEELAIPRTEVSILGTPDFLYNQWGFLLRPVLGFVSGAGYAALRPSPAEVADTFTVPLSFFRETKPEVYVYTLTPSPPEGFPYGAVGVTRNYPWAAGRTEVPVWYWQGRAVWGMTARLIQGLILPSKP